MDISGSINQPVSFYSKNTGNMINTYMEHENKVYQENVFVPEFGMEKITKPIKKQEKKFKKNKRLNTYDSDYLPDETFEETTIKEDNNFFIQPELKNTRNRIKKSVEYILTSIPLINYYYLRKKKNKIENTVKKLNDISQNVDELINTTMPYGEENSLYNDIAKNLTNAATILSQTNKKEI